MNGNIDPLRLGPLQDDEVQQLRRLARFLVRHEKDFESVFKLADSWQKWGWFKKLFFRLAVAITTLASATYAAKDIIMGFFGKGP
jgi:hypothetical protein